MFSMRGKPKTRQIDATDVCFNRNVELALVLGRRQFAAGRWAMENVVENQIVELERRYWQALVNGDNDTTVMLSDDPCIVAGAQGIASLDRPAVAGMMRQATWKLRSFEIDPDLKVRQIGDDVVVLAYKVREDLTVDGRELKIEASDTSTWVRRDGRWRCALHTEALAGDPFGRDRTAAGSPAP